jgi:outer membrane assembly lipoprotein YfiO
MKQNWWHFWYCTIILATTFSSILHTFQDSYSITTSGGASQQNPLDATLDSFKSSTTRALKIEDKKAEPAPDQLAELPADPTLPQKGWFGRQCDRVKEWFNPANKKKTLRNMDYNEREAFKNKCLAENDRFNAIRTLELMVPVCTDLNKLKDILLELADLLFDEGRLEAAGKTYREFVKYYPGNEKVEYALYKAVICKFYTTLDPERDQSNTRETIELADKFLEREEIFRTHSQEVRTVRTQCYQRLFDSEISIFKFYCNRGRYKSANTRLANIRKEFIQHVPNSDPYLLTLEIDLAQQVKDTPRFEEKQKELAEKFPHYQETILAQKDDKKQNDTTNTPSIS